MTAFAYKLSSDHPVPFTETERNESAEKRQASAQSVVYEGLSVRLIPAPLVKRVLAFAIDLGIISTIFYVLLVGFGFLLGVLGLSSGIFAAGKKGGPDLSWITGIMLIVVVVIGLLVILSVYDFYFIRHEYKSGSTPGKRLFGLRVVSIDGGRLSLSQCVIRDLIRYVDTLLVLPGLICVLLSKENRRIGDFAAGTMVVHSREREESANFVYIKRAEYQLLCDALKPPVVPEETCRKYLEFAYGRYLSMQRSGAEADAQYLQIAREFLPEAVKRNVEGQTLMLFFAEHCSQLINHGR